MLNTRTIVSGSVVLGAPLYVDGVHQGIVHGYFKPVDENCKYQFIELKFEEGYKLAIIEGNNIYIPENAYEIEKNDSNIELWCGHHGLIGSGDINDEDGGSIYYRTHGDVKVKVDPQIIEVEIYHFDDLVERDGKWSCSASGRMKFMLDFYQNSMLKFLIPVAMMPCGTRREVDRITVYFSNIHSLNNVF